MENNKETILVVEDNPRHLRLIQVILENAGWKTEGVRSAEEALQKLGIVEAKEDNKAEVTLPDAVTIFVELPKPGIDGLKLLEKMRENSKTKEIPEVLITIHGYDKKVKKLAKNHGCSVIPKPFDSIDVVREVSRCLKKKERKHRLDC